MADEEKLWSPGGGRQEPSSEGRQEPTLKRSAPRGDNPIKRAPAGDAPLTAPRREPLEERKRGGLGGESAEGGGWFGGDGLSIGKIAAGIVHTTGFFVSTGLFVALGALLFAGLYLNRLGADLPDYQALSNYEPPVTTRVYAGDGTLVAEFARERRLFVPVEAIPQRLVNAFVAAEDKSFFEHGGLDMRGILRASFANIGNIAQGDRLEGGSTITQQVAKNFLLSSEQRLERKLREWLVTFRIERAFEKEQILELYLNEIYLGNRSYGVAAAALNYFDKSLEELEIYEAAYLAAIPKGPSNYHPVRNRQRAIDRRNWVINRMREDGYITDEEAREAAAMDLGARIAPPLGARNWASEYFAEEVRKETARLYGVEALYDGGLSVRTTVNPQMQKLAGVVLRKGLVTYDQRHGWRGPIETVDLGEDWAATLGERLEALGEARVVAQDLAPWRPAIVTAVNADAAEIGFEDGSTGKISLSRLTWARAYQSPNRQGPEVKRASDVLSRGDVIFAEPAFDEVDGDDGQKIARRVDGEFELRQIPATNGGLVAIDPHTGRVLAMVGGFSFELSEFNRAVQARRQPGSTFKPFVYAAALDSGYTPSSKVLDAPFVAPSSTSWYKPGNYVEGQYAGLSTLRHGIEKSRNTMTARLAQDLGIGRLLDYVDRFDLSDNLPRELAISLGAGETTLMRITAAYATFVNGGKETRPFLIDRVQNRRGETIYRRDDRVCEGCNAAQYVGQLEPQLADSRAQVIDPRTAYQMVSFLEGVVQRGTGRRVARVVEHPVAGKTGTTNDYKDAWFVGFSPDLTAGVYIGFDLPQSLGTGEAGGRVAAPIFGDFMAGALDEAAPIPFRVPSGIRLVRVNAKTGRPAQPGEGNVILEAFKANDGSISALDDDGPLRRGPRGAQEDEDELEGIF